VYGYLTHNQGQIYPDRGAWTESDSFANLGLESFFLCAKRIFSGWQASKGILALHVSNSASFQSSAHVLDRNLNTGNNSSTGIGDGTE
jgi:hypothetical protein